MWAASPAEPEVTKISRFAGACKKTELTYAEARFHYRKRTVLTHDLEIAGRLEEHFIVGYDNIDKSRSLFVNAVVGEFLSPYVTLKTSIWMS